MKTSILEQRENQMSLLNKEHEIQRDQMANYQELMRLTAQELEVLDKELLKLGLKMTEYNAPNFETHSLTVTGKRNFYKELYISVRAEKTNNKFKFLTFRGYDSRGASTNTKRRRQKAEKMEQALNEKLPNGQVSVNDFSLEIGPRDKERVLISLFLKK